MDEYKALLDIVNVFDERLLVIKGWAVTFTLATLVVALQKKSNLIVWVVILSALCFWVLEAELKYHQTRYYSRMRAIEISQAELIPSGTERCFSKQGGGWIKGPLIDWSWEHPQEALTREICLRDKPGRFATYIYPHVAIPHSFIIFFCAIWLFISSRNNKKR